MRSRLKPVVDIPRIWRNEIPVEKPLSAEEKVHALQLMMEATIDFHHTGVVVDLIRSYTQAIVTGTKVKIEINRRKRFFSLTLRVQELRKIIRNHTEEDKTKWIREDTVWVKDLKDEQGNALYVWTYKNGKGELCERDGTPREKPLILTQACTSWDIWQLRRA